MKKLGMYSRMFLLVLVVALTAVSMAPAPAEAVKSCEYYCGEPGGYSCPYAPAGLDCYWSGW